MAAVLEQVQNSRNDSAVNKAGAPRDTAAELARYGVLRRLAPALKHDMVVSLQSLMIKAELLSTKLEKGMPPSAEMQKQLSALHRLARDAVAGCLKVATWIEPAEDESIALKDGVRECVDLVRSNFSFRGFAIENTVDDSFEVGRVLLRNLLVAALLALTDARAEPCEVFIACTLQDGSAVLAVRCGDACEAGETALLAGGFRQLDWDDVQALAASESIELSRNADAIVMTLPRRVVTTPLKIAPL